MILNEDLALTYLVQTYVKTPFVQHSLQSFLYCLRNWASRLMQKTQEIEKTEVSHLSAA